ncbi:MAG TPA: type II toxin-antitoxin system VapC family toxin [Candidatus Acidoferrales bacterium]
MKTYVLDASAVLDLLENGPGAQRVEQILAGADKRENAVSMSVLNWGEVFYNVWQHHGEEAARSAIAELSRLPIEIVPVDQEQALKAGEIKTFHKLSFVDCVAGSLAELRNSTLVTADRDFKKVGRRIRVLWLARH